MRAGKGSNGRIVFATDGAGEEYEDVARRLASRYPTLDLRRLLDLVLVEAEMAPSAELAQAVCTDPSDDKFFACAVAAKADMIVSGDRHLLRASGYGGIVVLTPRVFVDRHLASKRA